MTVYMDSQLGERQREKERKESPSDVEGEHDQDESREALMGEEGKMKGALAARSPSQTLSKDGR